MFLCGGCHDQAGQFLPEKNILSSLVLAKEQKHLNGVFRKFYKSNEYQKQLQMCKKTNSSFTDSSFPPNKDSLGFQENLQRRIIWKRVSEVIGGCKMIEGDINPDDILQGSVGDCYFLASISALAQYEQRKRTISSIFGNKVELNGHGIYKMSVSYEGVIQEIVIDDYIPVYEVTGTPVFCKPNGKEIWVMLLEKAWAKMRGSYHNTTKGYAHTVFNCFSPAPCLSVSLAKDPRDLWTMLESITSKYPAVAGTKEKVDAGFVPSHAYTFLGAYSVKVKDDRCQLIQLRNPWGCEEYSGKCSETDVFFWAMVSKEEKERVRMNRVTDDGIFFLPYALFLDNFNCLDICFVEDQYHSDNQIVTLYNHREKLFSFTLNEDSCVYLTVQKTSHINNQLKNEKTDFGYCQMVLATYDNFQYINGKLQKSFPDATMKIPHLKKGKYYLYVRGNDPFSKQKSFQASVSTYSGAIIDIQPQENSIEASEFLSNVYKVHATRLNKNKIKNGRNKEDWICQEMLYEEGGFGYIAVSVDSASTAKMIIELDSQLIESSGYNIQTSSWNENTEEKVEPGQVNILVLSPKMDNETKRNFPPPGYSLSRLI